MTKEQLADVFGGLLKILYPNADEPAHKEMESMATLLAETLERYVDARIEAKRQ